MLVGEDQDMIFEDDKQIAEFLPLTGLVCTLVLINAGIAPESQEGPFAEFGHEPLRFRGWRRLSDRVRLSVVHEGGNASTVVVSSVFRST